MASIHEDKRNPKKVRWQVRYRHEGKQRTKGNFRTKREAQRWLHDNEAKIQSGDYIDPQRGKQKFGEFAEQWLKDQHHLKPKTLHGYRSKLETVLIPRIGNLPLSSMTQRRMQDLFNELAEHYGPHSLQGFRIVARRIMNSAIEQDLVRKNPFVGLKLPTPQKKKMQVLTAAQVEALAAALPPRNQTMIRFAAWTGLRSGELAALRVGDFSEDLSTVRVTRNVADVAGTLHEGTTKNRQNRTVGVPGSLRDELREHLALVHPTGTTAESYVFPGDKGGVLRMANFYRRNYRPAVKQALPEELLGMTFHDLRHTCAALLIGLGAHPKEIADRLGHSSINVTMDTYGHIFPDRHEAMTNLIDEAMRGAK